MRLNLENDYAYRIILKFAKSPEGTKFRSKDLSDELLIPERFTYRILRKLLTSGLIDSIRGPRGGYVLAKEPKEITLYDVYSSISGDMVINQCLLGDYCDAANGLCEIHFELEKIQNELINKFNSVNFEDLINKKKSDKNA
ncbi:MAG: Rrf2 family transcriptional regulator [Tissierellia bacterium]|nr:Rrf2 family transcriptional regulator [Tissierellia bacterium]